MAGPTTLSSETVDKHLSVLGREYCRYALCYFRNRSTEATLTDLARFIRERNSRVDDESRIAVRLHHSTLPRLADAGFVEYDARSNTARYRGRPRLETWVDHAVEQVEAPNDLA